MYANAVHSDIRAWRFEAADEGERSLIACESQRPPRCLSDRESQQQSGTVRVIAFFARRMSNQDSWGKKVLLRVGKFAMMAGVAIAVTYRYVF